MKLFVLLISCLTSLPCLALQKVAIETSQGTIKLELFDEKAPETVRNFLQYVQSKHYDNTLFHRVIPGFMIQGGGYNERFEEKATRKPIRNEADNGLKNEIGTIAMARRGDPDSASAQFFINVANNRFLDHREKSYQGYGYCVFGRVTEGLDVVNRIAKTPTGFQSGMADVPKTPVVIHQVKLLP